ncbi:glycosyltransferase family 2 protein [Micromonospora sp. KC721]|uniref:glycosyltransferase n=1 Tax=Micromonospora sp. KC721 TaxID=2530380 RepID=UPI00104753B0|nr:glycosyltransferase [Micromonospora sp. KC721]TDB82454.1 glycosyltransferase [Micromonospora sp. KC721]
MTVGTDRPGVSVIVPVKGRVAETRRMLQSIMVAAAQCPETVETILVDDSTPQDARQHQINCDRYGARYVRGPRHVGAKRNRGAELAVHDLLLFIDSDCRASPDLLRRYVAGMRAAPPQVVGIAGPTVVEHSKTRVFEIMRRSHLLNGDLEMPGAGRPLAWATTSNLFLRRSALRAVGGFAERTVGATGGEDVDLGLRLTGRGWIIRSDPDALVTHDRMSTDTVRSVCRRLYGYGRSEQWLSTVYPHLRRPRLMPIVALGLTAGIAVVTAHRSRGRSLLLLPVAGATAVGLGAVLRYADDEPPRRLSHAAARTMLEWVFDLGAVAEAVRLRRPVLLFTGFRSPDRDPAA